MKCTLIRCPQSIGKFVSAGYAVPPIGLAYVAAAARKAGHDVQVIDPTGEAIDHYAPLGEGGHILRRGLSDAEILERIPADAEVIGFSLLFSQDWPLARDLINRVRERHPEAVLVAGGEHFTAEPVGALEDSALDYVVHGEGEQIFVELLTQLEAGKPVEDVGGIYLRTDDGVRISSAAPRVRDIDAIPWPAWDLLPIEVYLDGGHGWGVDRGRNMPINATRGCPYQCTFCSSPTMWTTRWYARDPADVIAEIKLYMERYRATNFDFQDLTAILKRDWIIEFCHLLIQEDLHITWQLPSGTRSEALDEEVLTLLYASGCRNITYAPESGSDVILKRIKKKISRDRMLRSMRACVKSGCNVKANFVFGFPDDRYSDYRQSFGFLARMAWVGVHDISIAPFRPYPGSELFRQLQDRGTFPHKLGDPYYKDLATAIENLPLVGSAKATSFCSNMSPTGLHRLCRGAFLWFFLLSWLFRPQRVFKIFYALVTEKQESRLDKSLVDMKRRLIRSWKGQRGMEVGEINPY